MVRTPAVHTSKGSGQFQSPLKAKGFGLGPQNGGSACGGGGGPGSARAAAAWTWRGHWRGRPRSLHTAARAAWEGLAAPALPATPRRQNP